MLLGKSIMSRLLIGNKYGSLEWLAADIKVVLYIPPALIFFNHFSLISHVFIMFNDYSN